MNKTYIKYFFYDLHKIHVFCVFYSSIRNIEWKLRLTNFKMRI